MNCDFAGLLVALATPFDRDGRLDLAALDRLCAHVRNGGADALVALGSTGEASALDDAERDLVLRTAIAAAGPLPVIAGCTAAATAAATAACIRARELGARGALVAVPPYVRPTQAGIVAHFAAIAAAADGWPLIAYNVPSRTGTNLLPATAADLWRIPEVVALKESSGNLQQIGELAAALPPGRHLLAGDDALALPSLALGAQGLVSVAGNVLPGRVRRLVAAAREGQFAAARAAHAALLPFFLALSAEPNPVPLKAALQEHGLCGDAVRLPLLPATTATRDRLRAARLQDLP
jgi:4-hydroxy-tetrahydrodipicolinate synthase